MSDQSESRLARLRAQAAVIHKLYATNMLPIPVSEIELHTVREPWWTTLTAPLRALRESVKQFSLPPPELFYSAKGGLASAVGLAKRGERVPITHLATDDATPLTLCIEGLPKGWHYGAILLLPNSNPLTFKFLLPRIVAVPLTTPPDLDARPFITRNRLEAAIRMTEPPGVYALAVFVASSDQPLQSLVQVALGRMTHADALAQLFESSKARDVELLASVLEIDIRAS